MTVSTFAEPFTGTAHNDFSVWAREVREYRIERAYDRPTIKLYDGDWKYRGTVYGELSGRINPMLNQTGTIQIKLPIDFDDRRRTWAAFWALDEDTRRMPRPDDSIPGANIHVIVETMGARIGGRMKPQNGVTITRGEKGDEVTIDFLDDIEELKHVHTAGNPFLPISLIQQPKAWMLLAQADHGLLLTLAANLLRLQLSNIALPADLLDPDTWPENPLDLWAESQIIVMPRKIGDSIAPLSLVVGSIRTSWFDVAAPILEDAELQLWTRRWLTGDPEPWEGAGTGFRQGTLLVDIRDKSGFRLGTSIGGNLLTGLTRSIASVLTNHVEDTYDLVSGETITEEELALIQIPYRLPGILGTQPENPYVVYRDGDITGIQTSEFSRSPGGPGRITVGGQSMPGVNELISAAINYGGDVLGDNLNAVIAAGGGYSITVGSIGSALDAFLNPIYRDSILAHMSIPLLARVQYQGWGHYLETTSTNVTQAFTAASVMDLRARRRETDPDTAFTLQVANASPWLIGDNGAGHWWLGDRVGGTQKYLMPRVFVRRCRELDISWDGGKGLVISAKFGETRSKKDGIERMSELIAKSMGGLQQIGLW